MNNFYKDIEQRQEYNKNILDIPKHLKDLNLIGLRGIVVRLFKLTEHTTSESGLSQLQFSVEMGESGRPKAALDSKVYQRRAAVVKISPEAQVYMEDNWKQEPLEIGDIVWPDPQSIAKHNEFIVNVNTALANDDGYLLLIPSQILAKE